MLDQIQFITSDASELSHEAQCRLALDSGITWIQLRMKDASEFDLEQQAVACKELCEDYKADLIINDHVVLAKRVMADGVHLGKEDMPCVDAKAILGTLPIIGATANSFADIQQVAKAPVDYIGLGPYAHTTTKKNLSPILGLEGYTNILAQMDKAHIKLPIFAIGGITLEDLKPILATGVYGVAVSSLLLNADNFEATVNDIKSHLVLEQ